MKLLILATLFVSIIGIVIKDYSPITIVALFIVILVCFLLLDENVQIRIIKSKQRQIRELDAEITELRNVIHSRTQSYEDLADDYQHLQNKYNEALND